MTSRNTKALNTTTLPDIGDATLLLRIPPMRIRRAAEIQGRSVSDFVVAATQAAAAVRLDQRRQYLWLARLGFVFQAR
jgi:hypothetical protein